uniref:Uncharacterized protein LOC102810317 n=1 Tax=Saccoglossus kowalevskii TaxID=10224 RepID=A0ABM0MGB8_SACKO|nr:PREDICTED: uncharacterized protein LOC102810317 [Saccoglossus kowalevskii]
MREDNEINALELANELYNTFGVAVSSTTINREKVKMGWVRSGVVRFRNVHLVKPVNKPKRFKWSAHMIIAEEEFENVVFTGATKIEMRWASDMSTTKIKRPAEVIHPISVMIWTGISRKGATKICIFNEEMDSERYQAILNDHLLPYLAHQDMITDHRLMQNPDDPNYTSCSTVRWMKDYGVNWWPTPSESPDINPNEDIWHDLKKYLARRKPMTKEELVDSIDYWWTQVMTVKKCNEYIDLLFYITMHIILKNGEATGM